MNKLFVRKIYTNHLLHILLALILGGLVTYLILEAKNPIRNIITRDGGKNFILTSPILDCENVGELDSATISHTAFEKKVETIAEKYSIEDYSVYFRKLNEGQWIGINEKDFFAPASLMKTQLLIAFLKRVEKEPELLSTTVVAKKEFFERALIQSVDVAPTLVEGQTYTLQEIAEHTIQQSDNVATLILLEYVQKPDLDGLFEAIGVTKKEVDGDVNIRVKDFGAFFRVLYNASYLNKEMSELALSILLKSNFNRGIAASVPDGVLVAHKYGERTLEEEMQGIEFVQERQLHDCGIVYVPGAPYIVCIMTKGGDFVVQQKFIAETARYIYVEVKDSTK